MKTSSATRVTETTFEGVPAVEISTAKAKMVIPTAFGPRIASFGRPRGRNLLFWDPKGIHRIGDFTIRGGHRIWMTRPMADETEETYAPDDAPVEVRSRGTVVQVIGPEDPVRKLRRSLSIRALDDETFSVVSRIENRGQMLWSGGVWGITCTKPARGTRYGIPLGDGSGWDMFRIGLARRWADHKVRLADPQFTICEGAMVLDPQGRESKRFVEAPQGVIGMTDPGERLSFIKKVEFTPGASYPMSCNIAVFVAKKNLLVEMETMGAEKGLRPGESVESEEIWALRPPIDWTRVTPEKPVL
jgi:hypothetical protein